MKVLEFSYVIFTASVTFSTLVKGQTPIINTTEASKSTTQLFTQTGVTTPITTVPVSQDSGELTTKPILTQQTQTPTTDNDATHPISKRSTNSLPNDLTTISTKGVLTTNKKGITNDPGFAGKIVGVMLGIAAFTALLIIGGTALQKYLRRRAIKKAEKPEPPSNFNNPVDFSGNVDSSV
ncbi:uncharacterized protein LOC120331946 [Styela clava]|uniref:uncharacterized protein LOC120331946 n=1 Tax=Styela clava TaxID=7725 RepID=UPI00193AC858|nr:uncharacterized protein LOC120331946 [Styela clava]